LDELAVEQESEGRKTRPRDLCGLSNFGIRCKSETGLSSQAFSTGSKDFQAKEIDIFGIIAWMNLNYHSWAFSILNLQAPS
jgi:hypothetical protein